MPRVLSATEARVHFGDLLRRVVEDRETVIVERNGTSQVAVLPVEEYHALQAARSRQADWGDLLDEVVTLVDRDLAGRTPTPGDQIIHRMREARDEEILGLR